MDRGEMTANCRKLNPAVTPTAATKPDVVSLLEQIWKLVHIFDPANALFLDSH